MGVEDHNCNNLHKLNIMETETSNNGVDHSVEPPFMVIRTFSKDVVLSIVILNSDLFIMALDICTVEGFECNVYKR